MESIGVQQGVQDKIVRGVEEFTDRKEGRIDFECSPVWITGRSEEREVAPDDGVDWP